MSKIGRLPIKLPPEVTLKVADELVTVTGTLGTLTLSLPKGITLLEEADIVKVVNQNPADRSTWSLHGLVRAKLANLVKGVSVGFERILDINGVGFRAEIKNDTLRLHIGLSHPVDLAVLPGVAIKIVKNEITLSGIDKEAVGEMTARIRAQKPPEPYKGKGIKYREEIIRRKQGKAVKTSTG